MNSAWELIAHSLRDELQEYGGLIGLFEEQQGALFRRDASGVLASVAVAVSSGATARGLRWRVVLVVVSLTCLSLRAPSLV